MALVNELLRKLNEEDEPLSKRIRLAKNSFKHTELYINKKEELVLEWLCKQGMKLVDSVEVWQTLEECLGSNRMLSLSVADLRSPAKAKLIQALSECLSVVPSPAERSNLTVLQCVLHLLENSNFQYYFKKQLHEFVTLNKTFLKAVSEIQNTELFIKSVQNILSFYKQFPRKDEFSALFIEDILISLVEAYCQLKSEDCNSSYTRLEILKCVQQIVFPRSNHSEISECIKSVYSLSSNESRIVRSELFICLSIAATQLSEDIVSNLYSVVFQAFVSSFKSDNTIIYQFFVILCYFIGFKPCVKAKDPEHSKIRLLEHKEMEKVFERGKANATSLYVLKGLIEVLIEDNVQLDAVIKDFSFKDWLQTLVVAIVVKPEIKAVTFDVLSCIIRLNPLIVEAKIGNVLERTLLMEKDSIEVRSSYISFLHCVLVMFSKLYRLQKFISKLLPTLNKAITNQTAERELNISSLDILPQEICTEFCNSTAILPSSQTTTMIKTLVYHLNQDCVEAVEKNQLDDGTLLYLQVVAELVSHFLNGVRMAEHSIPSLVVEKFVRAMMELREALGRLGTALLHQEHCRRLMVAFLRMCYSCGELHVLLLHYSPTCETNSSLHLAETQGDTSATNLEYLHSYLTNEQWNLVAQRITNFGEDACKEMLNKLILQKLRVVLLFSVDREDFAETNASVAKHIVDHINEAWPLLLGNNAAMLVPLLSRKQLLDMADHVVHKLATTDQQANVLCKSAVQENRPLVIALALAVLRRISKLFTKTKWKPNSSAALPGTNSQLARRVLTTLDPKTILQTEGGLSTMIPEVAAMINEACESYDPSQSVTTNGFVLDIVLLERYLRLLRSLPLSFLSKDVQTVLVFAVIAVAISLNATSAKEMEQFAGVKELYTELILVLLDGTRPPNLAAHLNVGWLVRWLSSAGLAHSLLLQRLFDMSLRQEGALQTLEAGVVLLDRAAVRREQSGTALETGTLLLRTLTKVKKVQVTKEDLTLCRKYKRRLSQGIVTFVKRARIDETPVSSLVMLDSFSLALRNYVVGSEKRLSKITPYIETFIQTALCGLSASDAPPQHVSACITLLGTVLQHKSKLHQFLPPDLVSQVWAILSSERHVANASAQLTRLFEVASQEEFQVITRSLLAETQTGCKNPEEGCKLDRLLGLWKYLALSSVNKTKSTVREAAVLEACLTLVTASALGTVQYHVVPLLQLELSLAHRRQVQSNSQLLDLFLETVANAPLGKETSLTDVVATVNTSLELLTALLLHCTVLVMDRIPPFLQCYRHLVTHLAKHGNLNQNLSEHDVAQLANCAHFIEKLTNTIVKHKKEFGRLSPYVIADVLHQFEKYTVYPMIKIHLMNCVYSLLHLCDKHGLSHLIRALPPASKELFKAVYTNYKKYYRFTGKV